MTTDAINFARNKRQSSGSWLLLAVLVVAALLVAFALMKPVKVLPVLVDAPDYALLDQNAELLATDDLNGKVVLYDFVYTHCTTVCPAMTGQMMQVHNRLDEQGLLGSNVHLVTISFDPERDTPDRLKYYADSMNADGDSWHWLTGDLIEIKQLVGGEFGVYFEKTALDEASAEAAGLTSEERATGYDFVHSTNYVLVDGGGRIRAEYQQMLDIDQTVRDIQLVVREENASPLMRLVLNAAHLVRAYP